LAREQSFPEKFFRNAFKTQQNFLQRNFPKKFSTDFQ